MAACPVVYRIYELDISSGSVVREADIRIPMKNPAVPKADIARRQLQRAALRLAKSHLPPSVRIRMLRRFKVG